jgi:hypothetical protein
MRARGLLRLRHNPLRHNPLDYGMQLGFDPGLPVRWGC